MKLKKNISQFAFPIFSLTLALTACSPAPLTQPTQPQTSVQTLQSNAKQTSQAYETISFTFNQPQTFKTQVVNAAELKFIKLSLVGDGISGSLDSGTELIPVSSGSATASIGSIPLQPGKLRVVSVQGYDADKNPLPAFMGKGYYHSQASQTQVNLRISRQYLLLGLALEKLLQSDPAKASAADLNALQNTIEQATGYDDNAKTFASDPTLFDPDKLAQVIAGGESFTSADLQNQAEVSPGNVNLTVTTKGGGPFTEALTLEVDDPKSTVKTIVVNSSSPQQPSLQVSPGNWTLKLKKADGSLVGSTTAQVGFDGNVSLGQSSLQVTLKPVLMLVSPSLGAATGGTLVSIAGAGFTGATAVKFGAVDATSFTVVSDNQILAVSPAGTAGQIDISVTTPGGSSVSGAHAPYHYINAPAISSLSTENGVIGSSVIITGTDFHPTAANNTVKFGAVTANVTQASATSLTVTVPNGISGVQNISVTANGLSSSGTHHYSVVPTLTSLSPNSGMVTGGSTVILTGSGFTGATAVKFGGVEATGFVVNSNTQITATAPAGSAGASQVAVVTPGGTSATGPHAQFTYQAGPTISSLSAENGTIGSTLVITGSGFNSTFGQNTVKFGSVTAVVNSGSATSLNVTVPAGISGTQNITVTANGLTSTGSHNFSILPGLTSLSQSSGATAGGNSIVLTGTGFTGATSVKFGGVNASSYLISGDTQITAVVPAGVAGQVDVTVTNTAGSSPTNANTKYSYNANVLVSQTSGTGNTLMGLTYGNSLFVTVGIGGQLRTSADGVTWTARTSGIVNDLYGIGYGNGRYIAVGDNGRIISSTNASSWTSHSSANSNQLEDVAWGNNRFVTVGTGGAILSSSDGVSWTVRSSGTFAALRSVVYANGLFVTTGGGGVVLTSPDGITWTSRSAATTIEQYGLTYGNGLFVSTGISGTIMTSPDGMNWTLRTSGTNAAILNVMYANSKFVVTGNNGVMLTSADGINWSSVSSGTLNHLRGIAYDGTKFVVTGIGGVAFTSVGL